MPWSCKRSRYLAGDESDCKVGPGSPPLHTCFRKGQSGNPGGRSRKRLAARLRDVLYEPALVTIDDLRVARGIFPDWGPYAVSKASLDKLVKIYAGEIGKTRVRANLLDPGIVRTRLRARAFPGEDPRRLPPPEGVADAFLDLALRECDRNGEVVIASAVSLRPND